MNGVGKYVLTASQDRTARFWDASTGAQLRLFPSHANTAIASAIFAPDRPQRGDRQL